MTHHQTEAFKVLKEQHRLAGRNGLRYLDFIYGPTALPIRHRISNTLHNANFSKSDKRCQYGNLRQALIEAVGAEGECIAARDHDFQAKVEALEL
jgi:hypothetical protein